MESRSVWGAFVRMLSWGAVMRGLPFSNNSDALVQFAEPHGIISAAQYEPRLPWHRGSQSASIDDAGKSSTAEMLILLGPRGIGGGFGVPGSRRGPC
jgi:hypothetical protein